MDDLLTISRPEMRARGPELVPAVVVAVVVGVLLVVAALSIRTPAMVQLTVENPQAWRSEVSVRSATSASWTEIGSVPRDGTLQFLELPDQGSQWVIRFSYAGESEEVAVSRDELAGQNWTVAVPEGFGEALSEAGVAQTTDTAGG